MKELLNSEDQRWREAQRNTAGGLLAGNFHLGIAARRHRVDSSHDFADTRFDEVPVIRTRHQHRHLSACRILLVGQLLIRRNEQIETGFFRRHQERPRR